MIQPNGTASPRLPASGYRMLVGPLLLLAALGGVLLWTYWTTLTELARRWDKDPSYSHGYLVPAFALVLLWLRREHLPRTLITDYCSLRRNQSSVISRHQSSVISRLLGLPLLAGGLSLRLVGAFIYLDWLDAISLLPCLAGLVLLAGGWRLFRWALPAVLFLFFMVPLPFRAEVALAGPLQSFATAASTYALQTIGFPAIAEGNVIVLNEVEMGIVEACSGLRMLMVFFALSTAAFLLTKRPTGQRFVLLLSAVPIALIANLIRITATGVLHETAGSEIANAVFHDLAGWLMMPVGLGLLAFELWLLKRLFTVPAPVQPVPVSYREDFGLPSSDFGLASFNPQSEIRNSKSSWLLSAEETQT